MARRFSVTFKDLGGRWRELELEEPGKADPVPVSLEEKGYDYDSRAFVQARMICCEDSLNQLIKQRLKQEDELKKRNCKPNKESGGDEDDDQDYEDALEVDEEAKKVDDGEQMDFVKPITRSMPEDPFPVMHPKEQAVCY
ncbi:OLC1v1006725C2 [Oldenlandia corymbosa var. corymbosa]|uniref:OLC1v1006725C2 n=1 Tax=Oldenlandia corymbosa var. corymbosa TaxID=529605 RepID=A0AAV1DKD7_OLDCO|nr:OLC1v1006725C2 [Oldenlandia corymbosa var. corymbosa]